MQKHTIFEAHASYVLGLLFTGDGRTLVSAGMDNRVKLWSVPDWQLTKTFAGHENSVNGIALAPDEKRLVTGSTDQTVNWTLQAELAIGTKAVNGMAFSPDGRWLAIGAADRKIRVWEL